MMAKWPTWRHFYHPPINFAFLSAVGRSVCLWRQNCLWRHFRQFFYCCKQSWNGLLLLKFVIIWTLTNFCLLWIVLLAIFFNILSICCLRDFLKPIKWLPSANFEVLAKKPGMDFINSFTLYAEFLHTLSQVKSSA